MNTIPNGWRFYTADFSIVGDKGRVMLTRDVVGTKWWHSLDESMQENTPLYISGYGENIREAIQNAIRCIPKD